MFVFHVASLCVFLLASFSPVYADTKTLTADASYIMGDGETPSFAEAMALQKAKQSALEEAGTYVQSYTRSVNQDLTQDEIQTIAGGVMHIEVLEKNRTLIGEGLRFYIRIKATVTTDQMDELVSRIKGKNVAQEYAALQAAYAKLSSELEVWKQQVTRTAQGSDHERALDRIREGATTLARIQQREGELFQRLVSGKQLIQSISREKEIVDELINRMVTSEQVITVGAVQPLLVPGDSIRLSLNVPFTVQVKETLHEAVSHAAEVLGGSLRSARAILLFSTPTFLERIDTSETARTNVTLVEFGNDRESMSYFQERVGRLAFHVTFLAGTREVGRCNLYSFKSTQYEGRRWLPMGRILPVSMVHIIQRPDTLPKGSPTEVPDVYSYESYRRGRGKQYVAILHDKVSFMAQHELPASDVNSLTSVQVSMGLIPDKAGSNGYTSECR